VIGDRDGGPERALCWDGKQCLVLRLRAEQRAEERERERDSVCVALMYNGEIVAV
jgi:hypothetical protein